VHVSGGGIHGGLEFARGIFVSGAARAIKASTDGEHWQDFDTGNSAELLDFTYGNGTFVAVGSNGTILQSGPVGSNFYQTSFHNGVFSAKYHGVPGTSYVFESSDTLEAGSWKLIATTKANSSEVQLSDTDAAGGKRFYRVHQK
jgi:hypothetical protein